VSGGDGVGLNERIVAALVKRGSRSRQAARQPQFPRQ
jgi:hypothetical protein